MEHYLEDLDYESDFIAKELKKIETSFRELLIVKSSSPLVLHQGPKFIDPNLV